MKTVIRTILQKTFKNNGGQNLISYSENFNSNIWTFGANAIRNAALAPDKTMTATLISGTGVGGTDISGFTTGYCRSIWIRSVSGSGLVYVCNGSAYSGGSNPSPLLVAINQTWQRYFTSSTPHYAQFYAVDMRANATLSSCYIWGAQLNVGATPTPYQKTNGVAKP